MKTFTVVALSLLVAAPAWAHVTVAPQQSPSGASQIYKVRVHNDGKGPTSSIELQIPDGVTVESVAPLANGKSETTKKANRITTIKWEVEVSVGKYVELAFGAKNPASGTQLNWNITERFKDGSTIEYTNKPGAKEKSSVTRLTSANTGATAK
jgi:uncharacterized protein YcnI